MEVLKINQLLEIEQFSAIRKRGEWTRTKKSLKNGP
jgi:hypothetical protein